MSAIELVDPQVQEVVRKERIPSVLTPLLRGVRAEDINVVHLRSDPLLYVKGELIAFWCE